MLKYIYPTVALCLSSCAWIQQHPDAVKTIGKDAKEIGAVAESEASATKRAVCQCQVSRTTPEEK